MQALLSVMMAGMNAILGGAKADPAILVGSFGYTIMVTLILTLIFEIFAKPLSILFSLSGGTSKEIIEVCTIYLRIASIGYIFMGFSVAVQGILQSLGYAIRPLIISLLRLVVLKRTYKEKIPRTF